MDLAKLFLVCCLFVADMAHALCTEAQLRGPYAFLGYGTWQAPPTDENSTETTSQVVQAIGVSGLGRGGVATVPWVTVRLGPESLWSAQNLTGTYRLNGSSCEVWAWFDVEGTNYTLYGVVTRGHNLIHAVVLSETIDVTGTFVSLERGCNANSIAGKWHSAQVQNTADTSDAVLKKLDCTRESCSVWQVASPEVESTANSTDVAVTYGPTPPYFCRFTFANDSSLAGYITVPYGNGMFAMQTSSDYWLATSFYRSAT